MKKILSESSKELDFKIGRIEHLKDQTIDFYVKKKEERSLEKLQEYLGNIHAHSELLIFSNKKNFKFIRKLCC